MEVTSEGVDGLIGAGPVEVVVAAEVEVARVAADERLWVEVADELHLVVGALDGFGLRALDGDGAKGRILDDVVRVAFCLRSKSRLSLSELSSNFWADMKRYVV